MLEKVALIIQGPIKSYGRTGTDAHLPLSELGQDGLVNYDSRENIQNIIDIYGSLFTHVVVSTWDTEVASMDRWEGAELVAAPDPGGVERRTADKRTYKLNNKYRQFLGILNGIEFLEEEGGVDYVVRVRTDQFLDLELLLRKVEDYYNASPNEEKQRVFVPTLHPATFMLHDLYFAASLPTMKRFCESVLAFDTFEFIDSVHREMVLKHAYCEYKDAIRVPDPAYFPHWPPHGASTPTKKIFEYMFTHVYTPLGREVFDTVVWRGGKESDEYIDRHMKEERRKPKSYSIPLLISTDWEVYHNFTAQTRGSRINFSMRCKAALGSVVWFSWMRFKSLIASARFLSS